MLSIPIQKDISEYQPKLVAGLTTRTAACIAIGLVLAIAVAVYFTAVWGITIDNVFPLAIAVSLPFLAAGFVKPHGMKFEKFLPRWFRHMLSDDYIVYRSTSYTDGAIHDMKHRGGEGKALMGVKGVEGYSFESEVGYGSQR